MVEIVNEWMGKEDETAMKVMTWDDKKEAWRPKDSDVATRLADAGSKKLLTGYIKAGVMNTLVDFDDHLDDSSQDWRNEGLALYSS